MIKPRLEWVPGATETPTTEGEWAMLWLILGIILLVIAIAGGAIIHPIIFVLALVALWMFFSGWRGRTI
jgi:hypothetical protein